MTEVVFKLYQDQDILILTQGYPEAVRVVIYICMLRTDLFNIFEHLDKKLGLLNFERNRTL